MCPPARLQASRTASAGSMRTAFASAHPPACPPARPPAGQPDSKRRVKAHCLQLHRLVDSVLGDHYDYATREDKAEAAAGPGPGPGPRGSLDVDLWPHIAVHGRVNWSSGEDDLLALALTR
jgi:hypothetical protein